MGQLVFQFAKRHLRPVIGIFVASCFTVVGVLMNAQQIATTVLPGWGWQLVGAGIFLLSVLSVLLHWDKEHAAKQAQTADPSVSRFAGKRPAETLDQQTTRLSYADELVRRFRSELRVVVLSHMEELMQSYLECYRTVRDLARQKEPVATQASFATGFAELAVSTGLQPQFQRVTDLARAQTDMTDHAILVAEIVLSWFDTAIFDAFRLLSRSITQSPWKRQRLSVGGARKTGSG